MSHAAAGARPPSSASSAAVDAASAGEIPLPSTPQPIHHGPAVADMAPSTTTLPPTLTPATTTRQSVSLGVLSADPPGDLTSSVPSTTTTLTNTLPPTQSAALRALNAPAFQSLASTSAGKSRPAKSTSSQTSLSSQPVVVRTYSGARHGSRPASGFNTPRKRPAMNGHGTQHASALAEGLARRNEALPSLADFSFSAILRAVDPEIREAIDAIADICAKSRMSLADEYDAHLPPQGEITGAGPNWPAGMGTLAGRGRLSRIGQAWATGENTLTAVPEASSSSERLAQGSRGSIAAGGSRKRSQSAYGSLKSVISGGSGKKRDSAEGLTACTGNEPQSPARADGPVSPQHPSIQLISSSQPSNQLSLDLSSTIKDIPEGVATQLRIPSQAFASKQPSHSRNASQNSIQAPRTRSSTFSSITSWLPWTRPTTMNLQSSQDITQAEARLREVLVISQSFSLAKGKAPAHGEP